MYWQHPQVEPPKATHVEMKYDSIFGEFLHFMPIKTLGYILFSRTISSNSVMKN